MGMLFQTMQICSVCLLIADPKLIVQLDFAKCVNSDDSAAVFKAFGDFLYYFSSGRKLSKEACFHFIIIGVTLFLLYGLVNKKHRFKKLDYHQEL